MNDLSFQTGSSVEHAFGEEAITFPAGLSFDLHNHLSKLNFY